MNRSSVGDGAGVCSVCKELVQGVDMVEHTRTHGDARTHFSMGWQDRVNPDNDRWKPGYRFYASQVSGAATGRKCRGFRHKVSRTYKVYFEIDQDGRLQHTGGVKPTEELVAHLTQLYERERPGSNWYPGAEE